MKSNTENLNPETIFEAQALSLKNCALLLMRKAKFEHALYLLNEAMYINSKVHGVQFLRAICLWHMFRREEALVAAKGELLENPEEKRCLEFINTRNPEVNITMQRPLLCNSERKIFSQNGEDGILEFIFQQVGFQNRNFLEIGCGDGTECNTAYLSLLRGWSGNLIESKQKSVTFAQKYYRDLPVNIINTMVTVDNVNSIIRESQGRVDLDLLSIDIDGNDYWIWKAIKMIEPRVVIIEYNAHLGFDSRVVIEYDENFRWDGSLYFGASLNAFATLADELGYYLVGCDSCGVNAFFVRKDLYSRKLIKIEAMTAFYPSLYYLVEFGLSMPTNRNWVSV
jgi:hypothetical protein